MLMSWQCRDIAMLLQEFDLEIKDKKGSHNVIAYNLSRLEYPTEKERMIGIEENFPDEQLLRCHPNTLVC